MTAGSVEWVERDDLGWSPSSGHGGAMADGQGRDFFISYIGVNRPWTEGAQWIAVQLEAADLLGRLRDGWTRPAAVLVDAASPVRCTTGSMTAFGCGGNAPGTGSRAARPRRAAVGYRRRHRRRHGKEL